jgi:uncharacterized membrane protein YozB (DUF420 family)
MTIPGSKTASFLPKLGWIAVATIVLLYVPMAAEFMLRFFGGGAHLWDHAFTAVVGDERALGPGSVHYDQHAVYAENRWIMLTHTLLGAFAIALSVLQLTNISRRKLAVHRWIGRVQVGLVLVSMPAAMIYLVFAGPSRTFDGPPFFLQLWALALGTLSNTLLGWRAMRLGEQAEHRVLMTFAFALLCTAPMLRFGYIVFGLAWPDASQVVTNMAGAAVLAVWAPLGAAIASRNIPEGARRSDLGPLPSVRFDHAVRLAAVLAFIGIVVAYLAIFDGIDRITIVSACALALGLVVTETSQRNAAPGSLAREEWRIYANALALGVPAIALLWAVYAIPFDRVSAFYGALLTGPAAALGAGIPLVASRRRTRRPVPSSLGQRMAPQLNG